MKTTAFFLALLALVPAADAGDVRAKVKALAAAPGVKNASWGLSVKDLSGKAVAAYNPQLNLTPASILKVFVTAAALDRLGPEKTFATGLYYGGKISEGVLKGDIYIRGAGDPSLGSRLIRGAKPLEQVLQEWAAAVSEGAGIRDVNGGVVGDDSAFEDWQPGSWAWEDSGNN